MNCLFVVFPLLLASLPPQAQGIGWQEAGARLVAEHTRAETCVSLLKQFGDAAVIAKGKLAYGEAKTEIDAVIAGLVVTLAEAVKEIHLDSQQADRLTRATIQTQLEAT